MQWRVRDPKKLRDGMPISLWIQWRAWWQLQGPPAHLRSDFHAAALAREIAKPHLLDKEDADLGNFLQPWHRRSDFRQWANLGEDDGPEEFVVD